MNWKSKKEIIISSFEKMDIDMLEMVLDDDKTYQDAPKYVFIEKLRGSFKEFKESKDTHLKAYEGKCAGNCTNKGCTGFSFLGNSSKNHIDLIFTETENDVDDIYCCTDFEITDKVEGRNKKILFDVFHDELSNFEPSEDYLLSSAKFKEAYKEIEVHFDKEPIDKDVYMYWLGKHNELFLNSSSDDVFDNFHYYEFEFYNLYYALLTYSTSYINDELCGIALKEFYLIANNDEKSVIDWLLKHNELGQRFFELDYGIIDSKENTVAVKRLKLSTLDFQQSIDFKTIFVNHFWAVMGKYTELSKENVKKAEIDVSHYLLLVKNQLESLKENRLE